MNIKLRKIRFLHVFIIAVFEFSALFFIKLVDVDTTINQPIKNGLGGIIVGFFSALIVIVILNLILERFHLTLGRERIRKISILPPSIFNAVLLAILFFIESFTAEIKIWNIIFGNAIVGLVTTPLSILITLLIYNHINLKISIPTLKIKKIGIWGIVITAGIYEMIALPLMATLPEYIVLGFDALSFALVGFAAGIVGGMAAMIAYNIFLRETIYINIEKIKDYKLY
ncbi:MAG: hypothetical protein ABII01_01690 [Candidatus Woesearchaeota archaeon]